MSQDLQLLYQTYAPMVFRRCHAILKNQEEAWDGVQEIFLRLAETTLPKRLRSPTAYLWRMATNYSLNRIKREGRSVSLPEELESAWGSTEEEVLRNLFLGHLFDRVSDRTRELAWYRWVDQLTWEETALASGLSVSGVRKHLVRFQALALNYKEHL